MVRRRFSGKAAVVAAVAVCAIAAAIHGVRWLQVGRLAGDLRDRAVAAREEGDHEAGYRLLSEYLQFRPDDVDAVVLAADALADVGRPGDLSRVIELRERAVRADPDRNAVRRDLAEDLLTLGERSPRSATFNAAREHLLRLRTDDPDARDGKLVAARAAAEAGLGNDREAVRWLLLAIDRTPADPVPYLRLARLLTAPGATVPAADLWADGPTPDDPAVRGLLDRPAAADRGETIAGDVAGLLADRAEPRRRGELGRAELLAGWDRPADAAEAARAAFLADGGAADSDVLRFGTDLELQLAAEAAAAGDAAGRERRLGRAGEYLAAAADLDPPDPRVARPAAQLALADGYNPESAAKARAALTAALGQLGAPDSPLSEVERLVTEWQARTLLAELALAAASDPGDATAAAAKTRLERATAEVERQLEGLAELGTFAETTQTIRGRLALLAGDAAAAARLLDRASAGLADGSVRVNDRGGALPIGPSARASADLLRADAYARLQNPERAVGILQEALRRDPGFADARRPLATLLTRQGDLDEALRVLAPVGGSPRLAPLVAELVVRRELAKPAGERNYAAAEAAVAAAEAAAAQNPDPAADPAGGDAAVAAYGPVLLRAQLLAARDDPDAAGGLIEELLDGDAAGAGVAVRSALWQTRLALELTRTDGTAEARRDAAERLLDEARGEVGETPGVRLAAVAVAQLRGPEAFRKALRDAADGAAGLPPADRSAVRTGLIRLAAENGRADLLRELWAAVAEDDPSDLAARNVLAEFALSDLAAARAGDDPAALAGAAEAFDAAAAEVRRLEGPGGPNADRLAAARVLADPAADAAALAGAADRLDAALRDRPLWPEAARLRGVLEERRGADRAAYDWFAKARTWGDESPDTLVRLVELLRARGRADEAADLLRAAERRTPGLVAGPVARLAWRVSAELNETDRLVELSTRLVREGGTAGDRLLKALSLGARYAGLPDRRRTGEAGRLLRDEALAAYEAVTDAAPADVAGWLARVQFLSRVGDAEAARTVAAAADAALPDLPEPDRTVRSARLREAAGDLAGAAERYRRAAAGEGADPAQNPAGNVADHPAAVAEAAAFYLRHGGRGAAQPLLDALAEAGAALPGAVAEWLRPRRALAAAVAGKWEDVGPALGQFPAPAEATPTQLREQLSLLAARDSLPFRRLRIERLEALGRTVGTTAGEALELAALLEATGRWEDARGLFGQVRAARPGLTQPLVSLVRGAVLHESTPPGGAGTLPPAVADRVRPLLDELRTLAPDADLTKLAAAEFAAATGDRPAAADLLREAAGLTGPGAAGAGPDGGDAEPADRAELQRLNLLAQTAERLGLTGAADDLFAALERRAERPADKTVRAAYLARAGRHAEALDLVERYADDAVPEATAARAVQVVALGAVPDAQRDRAAALVDAAGRKEPDSARILKVRADLLAARGRTAEAVDRYRQLLANSPDDTDLLNNLAWTIASAAGPGAGPVGDRGEPARLLDRAEAIDGPTLNLRDTRAMLPVLAASRGDAGDAPDPAALADAAAELADLVAVAPSPTLLFHAAAAKHAAGDTGAAAALDAALAAGLSFEALHPSEHPLLRRLLSDRVDSERPRAEG